MVVTLELDDPLLAERLIAYLRHGGLAVSPAGPGVLVVHPTVANDKSSLRGCRSRSRCGSRGVRAWTCGVRSRSLGLLAHFCSVRPGHV